MKSAFTLVLAVLVAMTSIATLAADAPATAPSASFPPATKLLDPKPLSAGHKVVTLFPPGHPALKAGPGSDKEEDFKPGKDRPNAVTNIHNPSIELYLATPEKANGMSV